MKYSLSLDSIASILSPSYQKRHGNRIKIRCIMHKDENPSCDIWINKEGELALNCFSCSDKSSLKVEAHEILKQYALKDKDNLPKEVERAKVVEEKLDILEPDSSDEPNITAAMKGLLGKSTMHWIYRTPKGKPYLMLMRFDNQGQRKTFTWYARVKGKGWVQSPRIGQVVPYSIDKIKENDIVVLVEGEKAAQRGNELAEKTNNKNIVFISMFGGINQLSKTSFSRIKLIGIKGLVAIPDNDSAGIKGMDRLVNTLKEEGIGCSTIAPSKLTITPKWDVGDIKDNENELINKLFSLILESKEDTQNREDISSLIDKQKRLVERFLAIINTGKDKDDKSDVVEDLKIRHKVDKTYAEIISLSSDIVDKMVELSEESTVDLMQIGDVSFSVDTYISLLSKLFIKVCSAKTEAVYLFSKRYGRRIPNDSFVQSNIKNGNYFGVLLYNETINNGKVKKAGVAKQGRSAKRPITQFLLDSSNLAEKVGFSPEEEPRKLFVDFDNTRTYNLYQGFRIKPVKHLTKEGERVGQPFFNHMKEVLCDDKGEEYEFLRKWIAHLVRYPHIKTIVGVGIFGGRGTGKSMFTEILSDLLGREKTLKVNSTQQLSRNFNAHLLGKLLIVSEEAVYGRDSRVNSMLKDLVTGSEMVIEEKFGAVTVHKDYRNIIFCANDEDFISTAKDERRYLALRVSDKYQGDEQYFIELAKMGTRKALEDIMYTLMNEVDVSERLPAVGNLGEAIKMSVDSLDDIDSFLLEIVREGIAKEFIPPYLYPMMGLNDMVGTAKVDIAYRWVATSSLYEYYQHLVNENRFGARAKQYIRNFNSFRRCICLRVRDIAISSQKMVDNNRNRGYIFCSREILDKFVGLHDFEGDEDE